MERYDQLFCENDRCMKMFFVKKRKINNSSYRYRHCPYCEKKGFSVSRIRYAGEENLNNKE